MSDLRIRHDIGTSLTVRDGNVELFTYVYRPDTPQLESPKPYLHPIRTRTGRPVSLFRPHDHVWHKGLSWSLPHLGEDNFWGGPTYIHGRFYVQLENNGEQRHRRFTTVEDTGGTAAIEHELDWITQAGDRIVTERRSLAATVLSGETWMLIFETALTNVSGHDIAIGSPTTKGRENAGYGGLFWRGPRSFTGGTLVTADSSGSGNDVRGQRHEWMAFAGRHDGVDAESLVLMVDHADNPHHPPQWFARSEEFACLNPAPFFSEELTVHDGAEARFRYGVAIADTGAEAAPDIAAAVRRELAALTDDSAWLAPRNRLLLQRSGGAHARPSRFAGGGGVTSTGGFSRGQREHFKEADLGLGGWFCGRRPACGCGVGLPVQE